MPSFAYLKISDLLACQAGAKTYGILKADDLASCNDTQAITDQESMAFSYSRMGSDGVVRPINAQMRAGRVATIVWSDGTFDEWRIGTVQDGRGVGGLITVTCNPLTLDLVERADSSAGKGWVSTLTNGERVYDFELTEQTPSDILTNYVIASAPSYITLGTVNPTNVIAALSVTNLTPWALALAVRDTLNQADVTCELRLRRNGTTDYKLDLVTQVGSSANVPVFFPHPALKSVRRKLDATLQATRVKATGSADPDGTPGILGRARWLVSNVSGNVVTLTDPNGGGGPVAFDSQWISAYLLRVKTGRTFAITSSSASGGTVTCSGGVSTLASGEFVEFRLTEPSTNTRTTTTRYAVASIVDGTHLTCSSNPITVDGQYTDWYARAWSASSGGSIVATTRISTSTASTDNVAVADTTGITTSHFIEFIQLDGAGEVASYADHPTYIVSDASGGYGVKIAEIPRAASLGITQIGQNAWMRTWTNASNPPDGYTVASGLDTARESTLVQYGPYSLHLTANISSGSVTVLCPAAYPNINLTSDRLSARARIYFQTFSLNTTYLDGTFTMGVYALTAAGAVGTLLGSKTVQPVGGTADNTDAIATGAWIEFKVEGMTLAPGDAPYGVAVQFSGLSSGGFYGILEYYLDAVELYPFSKCPDSDYEFGDANALHQAANAYLRTNAQPLAYYEVDVLDLARALPDDYARLALTVGGSLRVSDTDYGIDTTQRVLRIDRDLLTQTNTTLALANNAALLTRSIANGGPAGSVSRTVSGLVLGGGGASGTVDWANIQNKPTTFPPSAHTHATTDLVEAGVGYPVGKFTYGTAATEAIAVATGGLAVTLLTVTGGDILSVRVFGTNGTTDGFLDEVIVSNLIAPSVAGAVYTGDIGSPRARTYAMSASTLTLALGGAAGVTYNVYLAVTRLRP